jgi:glutamate-ammonia-ligase adenylyltransferase
LAWANEYPDLLTYSDNIRILEGLAANGLMTEAETGMLINAYRVYRRRVHHLKLKGENARVDNSEFTQERAAVADFWQQWIG